MTSLSLVTPSGHLTLGNLLGALRPMLAAARSGEPCYFGLSDLHAMTTAHDPGQLRTLSTEMATLLVALGLGEAGATLLRQSRVPAHTELAYLLECTAHTGELARMIQFKEKGRDRSGARVSLYTYPVLMAADILLYRPLSVPVGDDQRQHVELTRDLAARFNRDYGEVFVVPEIATPPVGARVMDLADPTAKMSKSAGPLAPGVIRLLDPPDVVRRKVARAVTDSDVGPGSVRRDRDAKPGITNLLDVLEGCGGSPAGLGDRATYGTLKRVVTDAVVATLEPLQRTYAELAADPGHVERVLEAGEDRARAVTAPVLAAARAAIGLS